MSDQPFDPGLSDLEARLAGLRPAPSRLDRDRTLYRAGQLGAAAHRPIVRFWPAVAASLAVLAVFEGLLLSRSVPPTIVERIVYVPAPPAATGQQPSAPAALLAQSAALPVRQLLNPESMGPTPAARLGWQLARYGLDALPPPPPIPVQIAIDIPDDRSAGRLLQKEMDLILNPGDPT